MTHNGSTIQVLVEIDHVLKTINKCKCCLQINLYFF